MADVFISYSRKDVALREMLSKALLERQLKVWWDESGIKGGQRFRAEIEKELDQAGAVVVIWSEHSVNSKYVSEEAQVGMEADKLIPVTFDGVRPPWGFREIQAQSLAGWTGDANDPRFVSLIAQIDAAKRGRVGAAVMNAGAALKDAVSRHAQGSNAARNIFSALKFVDLFGLPLYRLFLGSLVVAALATALWFVPAALQSSAAGWPIIFVLTTGCVIVARSLYQSATVLSGKFSREFFDSPFSFWTVAAVIGAVAVLALSLPLGSLSVGAILEGAPIYFSGVLLLVTGLRLLGAAFGRLLAKT